MIVLDTVKGSVEIETYPGDAPKSVAHIVELVQEGVLSRAARALGAAGRRADGRSVHARHVEAGYLGPALRHAGRRGRAVEAAVRRGTVGLAYRKDQTPIAAGSQFFILTRPNPQLNGKYTAIGRVTKGLGVVEKLQVGDMIKSASMK